MKAEKKRRLKAAGWIVQPADDWGTTDLEIVGPGPCTASLTSVYEDVLERGWHRGRLNGWGRRGRRRRRGGGGRGRS